jgi:hypothetical protein
MGSKFRAFSQVNFAIKLSRPDSAEYIRIWLTSAFFGWLVNRAARRSHVEQRIVPPLQERPAASRMHGSTSVHSRWSISINVYLSFVNLYFGNYVY